MHSEIPWEKIAVFDINHGGLSIAKQLLKHGVNVAVFDVYGKISEEELKKEENEYGFKVSAHLSDLDESFDIVCLPVHLNPENSFFKKAAELGLPTVTHHEMVGRILRSNPKIVDRYLIEITGVRGKTSTAVLLAQMLSYKNRVLLHTSEGMTFWDGGKFERIEPGISISPAYIPELADLAFERKYMPDTLIFEVSLGFTGAQDIGILTEAQPDYLIAGGTLSSTDAKTKMISRSKENSLFVVDYDDLEMIQNYIREDQELVVFDESGSAVEESTPTDVYLNIATGPDGEPVADIESSRTGIFFRAELNTGYDISSYKIAMVASVATALELDIPEQQIAETISGFEGVKGRMREYIENGCLILDNSNSGLTIETTETAIRYMIDKYLDKKSPDYDPNISRDITLVIGEEEKTVCEGLEPHDVEELIVNYRDYIKNLILVGGRMKPFIRDCPKEEEEALEKQEKDIFCGALYADTFREGLRQALEVSEEDDIVIAAVKCFR
ncbi:coenzyme F430 synthase [Methanimicrococcus sp. OttesenSCG-928-J09]|nr:coenzyme F430 synthase [Methanimicrococcus sp. OttesenSCG-928-J09]